MPVIALCRTVLLALSSLYFPDGSYLFTWLLLFAILALGWLFLSQENDFRLWLRAAILSVAAVPGIVLLIPAMILLLPLATRFDAQ